MKYFGNNILNINEIVDVFYDKDKYIEYLLYYDGEELKTINRDDVPNHKSLILNLKIKQKDIDTNNPIGIAKANLGCYWIVYKSKNNEHYYIHSLDIPHIHLNDDIKNKLDVANAEWKCGVFKKYFKDNNSKYNNKRKIEYYEKSKE